jgi:hypothetical protein
LSARAKDLSFSSSTAFKDFVSRKKNILMPEGVSGKVQKKSQFHRPQMNEVLGLNAIQFIVN